MMQWLGRAYMVCALFMFTTTNAVTRTFEEIKYKCARCECCRGGCNQTTGICDDQMACLDGYWGKQGYNNGGDDGDCRHACYGTDPPCTSCGMIGGKYCSTCVDGFYVEVFYYRGENPLCTLECNPVCQACVESASACTSCKPGFYGPASGCTNSCQSSCYICNDASSCTECPAGKHGTLCQEDCPVNCVRCNTSTQCLACPSNCLDDHGLKRICSMESGNCEFGCADRFYGDTCEDECSQGCVDMVCSQQDGHCDCIEGRSGDRCEEVEDQSMVLYAAVGSLCFIIVLLVVIVVIMCVLRYRNKTKSNKNDSMKSDKASNQHGGQAMTHINSGNDVEPGYESLEVNIADAGLYNTIDAVAGTNRV